MCVARFCEVETFADRQWRESLNLPSASPRLHRCYLPAAHPVQIFSPIHHHTVIEGDFRLGFLTSRVSCLAEVVGGEAGAGGASLLLRRWATKKAGGSTQNGRDSKPKNLGVKKYGGQVRNLCIFSLSFRPLWRKKDFSSYHSLVALCRIIGSLLKQHLRISNRIRKPPYFYSEENYVRFLVIRKP